MPAGVENIEQSAIISSGASFCFSWFSVLEVVYVQSYVSAERTAEATAKPGLQGSARPRIPGPGRHTLAMNPGHKPWAISLGSSALGHDTVAINDQLLNRVIATSFN